MKHNSKLVFQFTRRATSGYTARLDSASVRLWRCSPGLFAINSLRKVGFISVRLFTVPFTAFEQELPFSRAARAPASGIGIEGRL